MKEVCNIERNHEHAGQSRITVYLIDEIRLAQLGRKLKIEGVPKVVQLLLDSFENNGKGEMQDESGKN